MMAFIREAHGSSIQEPLGTYMAENRFLNRSSACRRALLPVRVVVERRLLTAESHLLNVIFNSPHASGAAQLLNLHGIDIKVNSISHKISDRSNEFLSSLYRKIGQKQENAAMQMIYNFFYQLRMREEFDLCNRILEDIDVNRIAPVLLVAILTVTAPLKKKLRQRTFFFKRAKEATVHLRGPAAADRILAGLE